MIAIAGLTQRICSSLRRAKALGYLAVNCDDADRAEALGFTMTSMLLILSAVAVSIGRGEALDLPVTSLRRPP